MRGQRSTTAGINDRIYGGDSLDTLSPMLDATLTINGFTVHLYLQSFIGSAAVGGGISQYIAKGSVSSANTLNEDELHFVSNNDGLVSLDTMSAPEHQYGSGYVAISTFDYGLNHYTAETFGYLSSDNNVTVSISGGVPEPAEWALLIVGFGLAGTLARRRGSGEIPTA